ncbi:MAG: GNAT family N-acetyltransferase, partial [Bacteroidales bacterium]|nr:GNAT family N-acetyltransferase [Bacteroidales bacterium]
MSNSLDLMVYNISTESIKPVTEWPETVLGFKLVDFRPKLFSLGRYGFDPFLNFMWYITSRGRFNILLLLDNELIVHSVYVTSKTYRFLYMGKDDINIGQAMTLPEYRGIGIGTALFKVIVAYYADRPRYLWANCALNNKASQRVFEKMEMKFVAYARMSMLTRIIRK